MQIKKIILILQIFSVLSLAKAEDSAFNSSNNNSVKISVYKNVYLNIPKFEQSLKTVFNNRNPRADVTNVSVLSAVKRKLRIGAQVIYDNTIRPLFRFTVDTGWWIRPRTES